MKKEKEKKKRKYKNKTQNKVQITKRNKDKHKITKDKPGLISKLGNSRPLSFGMDNTS
jgi:hypothetical protein